MGKKNRRFWDSLWSNDATFVHYYHRLTELAISMFEWDNVPDTIDVRYLELVLFKFGQAVFFYDDVMGYLALGNNEAGNFDVYGIPKRRRAISEYNGYHMRLDDSNSVIIYNNFLRTNSMLPIEMFAKRLYNLDRIIDVNANAQKTPVLINCSEQERLSLLNVYKEYDGNVPVIFADKDMTNKPLSSIKTDAPYVCDKIYQLKTQIWNEALTYLGISNTNFQKKERLISDEVSRNMGSVIASRYSRLDMRKKACEQINKMFGLNIDVFYKSDYRETDDEVMLDSATGEKFAQTMVTDLRTRTASIPKEGIPNG